MNRQHTIFGHVNNVVLAYLQRISVALVGMENGRPHAIGSGTCIEIGGRFFVATAEHVISPYSNENLLIVSRLERQDWTPRILGRGEDSTLDVGWLELDADVVGEMDRYFIPISKLRSFCHHVGQDIAVVHGFPRQFVDVDDAKMLLAVQPLCYGSTTLDTADMPELIVSRDIYLPFPNEDITKSDGSPAPPVAAPGMSGGGIWSVNVNADGVWSTESCRLIGIEHSWLRFKWVKGTQIQHWLQLLVRDLPELSPYISEHDIA
ncbi:MAG TPA: hypothetical protein PLF40_02230 [Kofleriaceae bacterium]|nr:hypothetical protein [Kofleriaceae bacterium]